MVPALMMPLSKEHSTEFWQFHLFVVFPSPKRNFQANQRWQSAIEDVDIMDSSQSNWAIALHSKDAHTFEAFFFMFSFCHLTNLPFILHRKSPHFWEFQEPILNYIEIHKYMCTARWRFYNEHSRDSHITSALEAPLFPPYQYSPVTTWKEPLFYRLSP